MKKSTTRVTVGGRELALSNLDKVLYPQSGFTKGQMIDYYVKVADTMLPHVRARALTLKRYPEGVDHPHFYEKECPSHRPPWMQTHEVPRSIKKQSDETVNYCVLTDVASLVWAANLASIEIHVLLSTVKDILRPTAMAFDLDPGPGIKLLDTAAAALELRKMFEMLGLQSFPKSSGKKGIHVYVPLNTPLSYDDTKPFAHAVALAMEQRFPGRIVSNMRKDLRQGKIFVDWSQNDDHKTTVAPYSLRAVEPPTVSAPLEWGEIERAVEKKDAAPLVFTPEAMLKRLKSRGDLFEPVLTLRQKLPDLEALKKNPAPKPARAPREKSRASTLLKTYRAKRHFDKTPEPSGDRPSAGRRPAGRRSAAESDDGPRFVIQKHAASHLHYDFRLESEGVLKSWAVPKGPSLNPEVKRLAMETEDHPMDYAGFEGIIPEGEYGGGTVMVWDTGTFVNVTEHKGKLIDFKKGLERGHVDFWLKGKKLKGAWSLIRIGPERHWILRKKPDAGAADEEAVEELPDSVVSGRSLDEIARDDGSRVWHSNRR